MLILKFFQLFILGIFYYIFNFFYSLIDFFILFFYCFFKLKENFFYKVKVYLAFIMLKFMIFYFYLFMPPRFVSLLEIKKYKLKTYDDQEEDNMGIYKGIGSYVYGETPYLTIFFIFNDLKRILDNIEYKKVVFIDLGCGVGKPVFFVNLLFNSFSLGIDNIDTFINKANLIKKILKLNKVFFIKQDVVYFLDNFKDYLKEFNLEDMKCFIIYLPATAFSKTLLNIIKLKILNIINTYDYKKFYFIVLSKKINIGSLNLIYKKDYYFSWFKSSVFFYESI